MNKKNTSYGTYVLLINIFVLIGTLFISKYIFINEHIDIKSIIVTILAIGILYYLFKKLGTRVAFIAAHMLLNTYPENMRKYKIKMMLK